MKKVYLFVPCLTAAMLLFTGCASGTQSAASSAPSSSAALESSGSGTDTASDASDKTGSAETSADVQVKDGEAYQEENGSVCADINRPVLVDGSGEELPANKEISAYIDGLIAEYEKTRDTAGEEGHYAVSSSYEVTHDGSQYLSLLITTTRTMASGAESFKAFTINKETGESVSLSELLGSEELLNQVSDNIISQMKSQMEADENVTYFLDSDTDGFTGLTGSENFYLSDSGSLVVVFDEYTVAPGFMGAVEFTIPEDVAGTFN